MPLPHWFILKGFPWSALCPLTLVQPLCLCALKAATGCKRPALSAFLDSGVASVTSGPSPVPGCSLKSPMWVVFSDALYSLPCDCEPCALSCWLVNGCPVTVFCCLLPCRLSHPAVSCCPVDYIFLMCQITALLPISPWYAIMLPCLLCSIAAPSCIYRFPNKHLHIGFSVICLHVLFLCAPSLSQKVLISY